MLHNSNRKMASTIGTCINCWNGDLKVPQHLEGASNVGMETENASTIGMCINCWNVASTFGRCIKCWNGD